MSVIGGHSYRGYQSPLPKILIVDLGHRYVELVPQPVLQALLHVPLIFQRVGIFHSNFQGQYADRSHLGEELSGDLLGDEGFQDIALFDVAEVVESDAAFHAALDFADVVLEAPQRADFAGVDHDVIAQHAHFARASQGAVLDNASGDHPDFGNTERVAHFRLAPIRLLEDRGE